MFQKPPIKAHFLVGVDFGRIQEFTAISLLKVEEYPTDFNPYDWTWKTAKRRSVIYLKRPALGTPYTEVIAFLARMLKNLPIEAQQTRTELVADFTGCGTPIVDMAKRMLRGDGIYGRLVPVWVVAGNSTKPKSDGFGGWNLPKRDLVDGMAIALQNRELQIDKRLDLAAVLEKEILAFQPKALKLTDQETEWRETEHEDLVLSVALACWRSRERQVGGPVSTVIPGTM